jgi:cytochrome P450
MLIMQCLVSMTTANAIVNAISGLLVSPDSQAGLYSSLIKKPLNTQEEIELYISQSLDGYPLQRLPRRVTGTSPIRVLDQNLPPGSQLLLMLGAANQSGEKESDANDEGPV